MGWVEGQPEKFDKGICHYTHISDWSVLAGSQPECQGVPIPFQILHVQLGCCTVQLFTLCLTGTFAHWGTFKYLFINSINLCSNLSPKFSCCCLSMPLMKIVQQSGLKGMATICHFCPVMSLVSRAVMSFVGSEIFEAPTTTPNISSYHTARAEVKCIIV